MTIIIFLIDTSGSMNQTTYLGTSLLDVAKGAVDYFLKIRQRDPIFRWDRYMLLTFEDPPSNIKAAWKESVATFVNELKKMTAQNLTSLGPALRHTFDLLNINRMASGIDTYGQGRIPFFLEPTIIICITDGRSITTGQSVLKELHLPGGDPMAGSEVTTDPFRWDQRLFSLCLRIPATPPVQDTNNMIPHCVDSPIQTMCEVTGGRTYKVTSRETLHRAIESLVTKCQNGVVLNFEKFGPDPAPIPRLQGENEDNRTIADSTVWHNCRKMIIVNRHPVKGYQQGYWPIPEGFWLDSNETTTLPPRDALPVVRFNCTDVPPMILEGFPFDKYELEPSPLTLVILERRQPNVAWQVFIRNSAKYSEDGHPFGYLKASSSLQVVNLFVMPYNYPALLPLLDEVKRSPQLSQNLGWKKRFDSYIMTMPNYYAPKLKVALRSFNLSHLVPDESLHYSIVSHIKKLRNKAKAEHEQVLGSVGQSGPPLCDGIRLLPPSGQAAKTAVIKRLNRLAGEFGGPNPHRSLPEFSAEPYADLKLAIPKQSGSNGGGEQTFKNAYDIPRNDVVAQVGRMRAQLLYKRDHKLDQEGSLHNQSIKMMGNYEEYNKTVPPPLRELETTPVRQHTFGNPFKVNKNLMIDEADESMMPNAQRVDKKRSAAANNLESPPMSPRPENKRKAGPLPRNIPARYLRSPSLSPSSTPPASPMHMMGDRRDENMPADVRIDETPRESDYDEDDFDMEHMEGGGGDHARTNGINNVALYEQHNNKLKKKIIQLVKRPGKNYETLFHQLTKVSGTVAMKCDFVQAIIKEATRFKKRNLVGLLSRYKELCQQSNQEGLGGRV